MGTDLVQVQRIAGTLARHPTFMQRVFTPGEIRYCEQHREPMPRYAARFAAKEAVLKALGTGLARGMRWQDVEIASGPSRKPVVVLHGAVAACAISLGVREVQLSMSHTEDYALACAVTVPLEARPSAADASTDVPRS